MPAGIGRVGDHALRGCRTEVEVAAKESRRGLMERLAVLAVAGTGADIEFLREMIVEIRKAGILSIMRRSDEASKPERITVENPAGRRVDRRVSRILVALLIREIAANEP